jgi:type VI secretion system secreted protein VgrG
MRKKLFVTLLFSLIFLVSSFVSAYIYTQQTQTITQTIKKHSLTLVPLGTAANFSVLAGSGITNTATTTITADAGTYPTTSETGFNTVTFVNGINHAGDAITQGAKIDLLTAYNNAAGQATTQTISADLGGQTLTAGVYTGAPSLGLTGTLTLDGQNNPNSSFIFQAPASTLTTASSSVVSLINGAQARNVFWQVGSSATIGTGSIFVGNILALTSITLSTNATVDGRALAINGAVTLDTNTINTIY